MKKKEDIINLTSRILEVLFFIALVFLFLRARIFKIHLPFLTISMTSVRNLAILMGFVWFILFSLKRFNIKRKTVLDRGLVVFLLWFVISCFFAQHPELSAKSLFVMLVYFSFYFVCSEVLSKKVKLKLVFYLLLACGSVVAAVNLVYHFREGISTIIERYPFWPGKQAISLFLVLSFLVIISVTILNWKNTKPLLRTVYILALATQVLCLILTYSRGAWFALLLALLVISSFRARKVLYLVLVLLCFTVFFSPESVRNRFDSIFERDDINIKQRFSVWETTLVLIKDNPTTGVGPGNFGTVHLERYRGADDEFRWWRKNYHAHNLYLQIASETGLVGLSIFVFLVLKVIISGYRIIRSEKDKFILSTKVGAYSAFIGFLFWSTAECTYTGEFSPLSFFHINLMIILYVNIIFYLPAQAATSKIQNG